MTPNPGSPQAVTAGCRCAVLDNGRGKGAWGGALDADGKRMFWIAVDCPLHHADIDPAILAARQEDTP